MYKIPKIKKELKKFIKDESGKISKKSILKAGAAVSMATFLATEVSAHHVQSFTHSNSLGLSYSGDTATGTHTHNMIHNQSC